MSARNSTTARVQSKSAIPYGRAPVGRVHAQGLQHIGRLQQHGFTKVACAGTTGPLDSVQSWRFCAAEGVCGLHSILHRILAPVLRRRAARSGTSWHYPNRPRSLAALLCVRASGAQCSQSILAVPTFPSGQSSELWKASGLPKGFTPDYARRQ
jgi:hypothetical protein